MPGRPISIQSHALVSRQPAYNIVSTAYPIRTPVKVSILALNIYTCAHALLFLLWPKGVPLLTTLNALRSQQETPLLPRPKPAAGCVPWSVLMPTSSHLQTAKHHSEVCSFIHIQETQAANADSNACEVRLGWSPPKEITRRHRTNHPSPDTPSPALGNSSTVRNPSCLAHTRQLSLHCTCRPAFQRMR